MYRQDWEPPKKRGLRDELYRIGLATALRLDQWLYLPAVLK